MKATLAVHKFTSCDGCQLAFLNAGESLLYLNELVEIVHFVEEGSLSPEQKVDIAFIEGSISTPQDIVRIKQIREQSKYLITIGACATAGGIQALRNVADKDAWMKSIYASPEYIQTLATSTAIAKHVPVDLELWGCPVNTKQVMDCIRALLNNTYPKIKRDAVCLECKRLGNVCVLVAQQQACLGPITQTGCYALCPTIHRACYACYGPAENANPIALGQWFAGMGVPNEIIVGQLQHINNQAAAFRKAAAYFKGIPIVIHKSK